MIAHLTITIRTDAGSGGTYAGTQVADAIDHALKVALAELNYTESIVGDDNDYRIRGHVDAHRFEAHVGYREVAS